MAATPAAADLVLNFDNDRPDASTVAGVHHLYRRRSQAISRNDRRHEHPSSGGGQSYSLSTLAAGVDVTNYHQAGFSFLSALH